MSPQPFEDPIDLRLDTHWSRFIYCDEPVDGDPLGAGRDARPDDPGATTSPLAAAAIPLAIYISLYLTIAAVVRGLEWPEVAAAIAPDASVPTEASSSGIPAGVRESPRRVAPGQASQWVDSARECRPGESAANDCVFN